MHAFHAGIYAPGLAAGQGEPGPCSGSGDGHIHYYVNGAMTMQYNTSHIQLTGLSNGNYEVIVELVDNSHNSFSPVNSFRSSFKYSGLVIFCNRQKGTVQIDRHLA